MFYNQIGGLIATLYAHSGSRYTDLDAIILNSPYLAAVETTPAESALLALLIRTRKSVDHDGGWYGRSIHVSNRGEWEFDLDKKPIEKVRLHGAYFSAVRNAQQDITKNRISIKYPILFMCSNRSIKADKTWRDEYGEGTISFLLIIYLIHC
jgi:alpha-beta hydrolase superfamily lysophospholipase